MRWIVALILFIAGSRSVHADQSCDLLVRETPRSFSIGPGHANIFVVEEKQKLYVYKLDIDTLAEDLRLAEQIFKASGSKILEVNLVLDTLEMPNAEVSHEMMPAQTLKYFERELSEQKPFVFRSEFIDGRIPQYTAEDVAPNDRRKILEESRVFQSELDRIYNWVKRTEPAFENRRVQVNFGFDSVLFKPEHRSEREITYGPRTLCIEAGDNSVCISYGRNFVVKDGRFILIDPS